MNRILRWLVILALVYFGVTEGVPWLRNRLSPRSLREPQGMNPAADCIDAATVVNEALADKVRRFGRPPLPIDRWTEAMDEMQDRLDEAELLCGCPGEACRLGREAVSEVGTQLAYFDSAVRGTLGATENPAVRQEHIFDLLRRARAVAFGN